MTIELKNAADAIDRARQRVSKADLAHGHGASADALVKANRALADAHARFAEIAGGRVEDDR
jgi:hypothetical protein